MDALAVYGVGVLAQLPFLVTHFYTGPLVDPLGGADISWIVGLAVPALLYWLIARRRTAHIPERTILAPQVTPPDNRGLPPPTRRPGARSVNGYGSP